jgi:hypothetical protein
MSFDRLVKSNKHTNEKLNNEIALVIVDGKARYAKLNTTPLELWDKSAVEEWYSYMMAFDENGNPIYYERSNKQYTAFGYWSKWKNKKKYDGIVFNPSNKHNKNKLNIYTGISVQPIKGKCDLILSHIFKIWCRSDQNHYSYILNWFARMIQQPEKPAEIAITLKSKQGVGKNIILDIFSDIFKNHHTVSTKLSDITGDFNDHLASSIFVFINEALWGGDKHKGGEGIIKTLITDKTITMHKKFMPKVQVTNCTHLVICSNKEWYITLDLDDRRFFTLTPSEEKKGDYQYFIELGNEISNQGKEAFLYFLKNRNIKSFNPRILPAQTKETAKERGGIKLLSEDTPIKWIVDFVNSQNGRGLIEDNIDWQYCEPKISKQEILQDYKKYCQEGKLFAGTDKTFYQKLKEILKPQTVQLTDGKRYYKFHKLPICKNFIVTAFNGDNPLNEEEITPFEDKSYYSSK